MNEQERAAWELHVFLTRLGVPYAIIGGLAVRQWGEPRFTQDVDVTAMLPLEDPVPILREIAAHFSPRLPDAVDFARRTRVLLVRASNGVPLDISMGLPGYEEEVMARAVDWELGPGKVGRLGSAGDLIIHRAVAGRPQDLRDIEGVSTARDQRWTPPPSVAGWERSSRCWRSLTCSNASRRRGAR